MKAPFGAVPLSKEELQTLLEMDRDDWRPSPEAEQRVLRRLGATLALPLGAPSAPPPLPADVLDAASQGAGAASQAAHVGQGASAAAKVASGHAAAGMTSTVASSAGSAALAGTGVAGLMKPLLLAAVVGVTTAVTIDYAVSTSAVTSRDTLEKTSAAATAASGGATTSPPISSEASTTRATAREQQAKPIPPAQPAPAVASERPTHPVSAEQRALSNEGEQRALSNEAATDQLEPDRRPATTTVERSQKRTPPMSRRHTRRQLRRARRRRHDDRADHRRAGRGWTPQTAKGGAAAIVDQDGKSAVSHEAASAARSSEPIETRTSTPRAVRVPARQKEGAPLSTLDAERRLLDAAHRALTAGDSRRAARLLHHYRRHFDGGVLGEEAEVMRIRLWVATGQRRRALNAARAFYANHPDSLLAPAVSAALSSRSER
jgi:hypothetical protein